MDKDVATFEKIIIRMPNWIGDLVMATPILTEVRHAFPKAHITAMALSPICDLLREDPDIDELFCFNKVSPFGRRSERRDIIGKLRQGEYDLGILLTHSFSSAWWFWRGHVRRRLGYKGQFRNLLLTDAVSLPNEIQEQHLVETYKQLLLPLGIPVSDEGPRLFFTEKEMEEARKLLYQLGIRSEHRLVGINPGAAYGTAKCWLPERFRQVTEKLVQQDNVRVLYFGDQATTTLTKEICKGLPVLNLAGSTTLRQLGALIKQCRVLLTNDSGPMHIAAAVGTPVVALFGSTNEKVTGPYKAQNATVIHKQVACSPCYKRVCPIDFRCMKRIETDEVFDALMQSLC
jgi:heptosyltransferase II